MLKKLFKKVKIPKYTNGSAGLDLAAYVESDILINEKHAILIALSIPKGFEMQKPRSGLSKKLLYLIHPKQLTRIIEERCY